MFHVGMIIKSRITRLQWTTSGSNLLAVHLLLMTLWTNSDGDSVKSYCDGDVFEAKCGRGEVVVIQSAVYGRMQLGQCVKVDMGYLGCSDNVIEHVDSRCSGRQACSMPISDKTFIGVQPCLELKTYLEASYTCVSVTNFKGSGCQRRLTSPVGYLASLPLYDTSLSTGCQVSNQWTVEGAAEQRVNLTLLDFSLQTSFKVERSSQDFCKLFPYAILSDANSNLGGRSVPVCSGRGRTSHVFLSTRSVINIQFNEMLITSRSINFILKYEVIGCSDPKLPPTGIWQKRQGDEVTVGCSENSLVWKLKCVDRSWVGNFGNCSSKSSLTGHQNNSQLEEIITQNLLTATVCGIAISVGVCVLIIGLILVKRRRRRVERPDDVNYFPSVRREIPSPNKAVQLKPRTTPALKMHSLDGDYREEAGELTKQDDLNKDQSRCHGKDCYDNRNCFKNGTSHVNCYPVYDRPSNTFGFNYRDNSGTCAPHIWQTPLPHPGNLRNVVDAEL